MERKRPGKNIHVFTIHCTGWCDAGEPELKIGRVKAPVQKTPATVLEEVDATALHHLLDEHEHVAVLFYSSLDHSSLRVTNVPKIYLTRICLNADKEDRDLIKLSREQLSSCFA